MTCKEHEMEKYMKFTMYEKASNEKKYIEDPYRAVNSRLMMKAVLFVRTIKNFVTIQYPKQTAQEKEKTKHLKW